LFLNAKACNAGLFYCLFQARSPFIAAGTGARVLAKIQDDGWWRFLADPSFSLSRRVSA